MKIPGNRYRPTHSNVTVQKCELTTGRSYKFYSRWTALHSGGQQIVTQAAAVVSPEL